MTTDAGSFLDDSLRAAEKAKRQQLAQFEADRDLQDLAVVLGEKPGRRFVWSILALTGVLDTALRRPAPGQPVDPLAMAYQDGARSMGVRWLRTLVEHFPVRFLEMLKESKE